MAARPHTPIQVSGISSTVSNEAHYRVVAPYDAGADQCLDNRTRCHCRTESVVPPTCHRPTDSWGIDHFPLEMNDAVNYPAIVKALKAIGFGGPVVLEICYARTNDEFVDYCRSAREHLIQLERKVARAR